MEVGRVLHGHNETSGLHAKRQHPVPAQELLIHEARGFGVDIVHAQLDEVEAQPAGYGPRKVRLPHVSQGEEYLAHTFSLSSPEPVRLLELLACDHTARHQDLPDPTRGSGGRRAATSTHGLGGKRNAKPSACLGE
jgi:hypothetical protein